MLKTFLVFDLSYQLFSFEILSLNKKLQDAIDSFIKNKRDFNSLTSCSSRQLLRMMKIPCKNIVSIQEANCDYQRVSFIFSNSCNIFSNLNYYFVYFLALCRFNDFHNQRRLRADQPNSLDGLNENY